jgi:hypothetical protein
MKEIKQKIEITSFHSGCFFWGRKSFFILYSCFD